MKTPMQRAQIDKSLIVKFSKTGQISTPTLMEETKPVVSGKREFDYRKTVKIKDFIWNFRTLRIGTQAKKSIKF